MPIIDWIILIIYILFIVWMSWIIGKKQKDQEDYYVGGRKMPAWQIALSIMATQVSAISLIGAPAFVALKTNGGLKWLQYEFAIPLAMIAIIFILVPVFHEKKYITIYQIVEEKFGPAPRLVLSIIFLLSRGLGSGVALLATGIVTAVLIKLPLFETILIIGIISILYTTFGGIKADIYSDILQLIILWVGTVIAIGYMIHILPMDHIMDTLRGNPRMDIFVMNQTGLGDSSPFSFWAMLIGGFFLYFSYYGCDQSQAQRLLTTATPKEAQKALLYNGMFRFFLVLTYLTLGVFLIAFIQYHPDFAATLKSQKSDFLVPMFLVRYFPSGLLGIMVAGFFAATMSSLDSALNSLSAATYKDVLEKIFPEKIKTFSPDQEVFISRLLTVLWGAVATIFALFLMSGQETVIELVNKIGSAFYGPVLGIFLLSIFARNRKAIPAIIALITGVTTNIVLWKFFPERVSWMWWNGIGFAVTISFYFLIILFSEGRRRVIIDKSLIALWKTQRTSLRFLYLLSIAFICFILIGWLIEVIF